MTRKEIVELREWIEKIQRDINTIRARLDEEARPQQRKFRGISRMIGKHEVTLLQLRKLSTTQFFSGIFIGACISIFLQFVVPIILRFLGL